MSDLISRESVEQAIRSYFVSLIEKGRYEVDVVDCNTELQVTISKMETVYDVKGVLNQLDDAYNNGTLGDYHNIVKGAVKDE